MHEPKRILLVVPPGGSYGRGVIDGVLRFNHEQGRVWEFRHEDSDAEAMARLRLTLRRWKPHGLIVYLRSRELAAVIRRKRIPAVNISGGLDLDAPVRVHADNVAVGRAGARHFLERGFRNFAFCGKPSEFYSRQRLEGFRAEVQAAGFKCHVFDTRVPDDGQWDWVRHMDELRKWLSSLPAPLCVMGSSDVRGPEIINACQHARLRVPDDVAVLGVDNDETICRVCTIPLSSIDVVPVRIGYEAASLLRRLMDGQRPGEPVLVPPAGVVVRQSTDVVAVQDECVSQALRFIRNNCTEPLRVKEVLRAVPVSRSKLQQRFKALLGRTIADEICRIHIDQAKRLLIETDMEMPKVAANCGFGSNSVFSVAFGREVGMTPSDYRKRFGRIAALKP